MESCTGGGVVNALTNIPGASEVLNFSAVTYSNEYKIKMGVKKEIIDQYSVYSQETADEMSYQISKYTNSTYGIGVTGKLNTIDKRNLFGQDNIVYISIFDQEKEKYFHQQITITGEKREQGKQQIIDAIITMLEEKVMKNQEKKNEKKYR